MKTPSALLLAGTLLVAGSAALLARVLLAPPPPQVVEKPVEAPTPKPTYPEILVASRDLRPGDFIDASAVQWTPSEHAVEKRFYYTRGSEAAEQLNGASVRHAVTAGTPLTSGVVVRPNEPGFIATVITPGMRAITVPTSKVASQHGMLASGDRVDVIVNLERGAEEGAMLAADGGQAQNSAPRLAAQTLLQNVRVLSLDNQPRSPQQLRPVESGNGKKNPDAYPSGLAQTVTLEVPPIYAERLALASQIGTLQLALRSSQDIGDGQVKVGSGQVTTLAKTTAVYSASAPSGNHRAQVRAFHGDAASTMQFDNQ